MTQEALDQGRFEGRVLAHLENLEKMGNELKECMKDHGKRIATLEAEQRGMKAWAAGAGAVAALALNWVMKLIPTLPIKP